MTAIFENKKQNYTKNHCCFLAILQHENQLPLFRVEMLEIQEFTATSPLSLAKMTNVMISFNHLSCTSYYSSTSDPTFNQGLLNQFPKRHKVPQLLSKTQKQTLKYVNLNTLIIFPTFTIFIN